MWIIAKTPSGRGAFVSIVQHREDAAMMRVRARTEEHLRAAFDGIIDITVIDHGADPSVADYRWHADVPRAAVAVALTAMLASIDFDSHVKEEVSGDDKALYSAMLRCWSNLHELQEPRSSTRLFDGYPFEDEWDDADDALDALQS